MNRANNRYYSVNNGIPALPYNTIYAIWVEEDRKWLADTLHYWRGLYLRYVMKNHDIAHRISEVIKLLEEVYGTKSNKESKGSSIRIRWTRDRAES